MELDSREALRIFRAKGVTWLRHANTVRTVCTFFKEGHLLARGVAHERGLAQTDQQTDRTDRELGIWYDLFFDASDVHARYNGRNFYGPVLLNFDLTLLEQDWLPLVWVTKLNPQHWRRDTPSSERWFSSIEELEKNYNPKDTGQHIVLRNVAGTVRLNPYLREVVVDWTTRCLPGRTESIAQQGFDAIVAASIAGGFPPGITTGLYRVHTSSVCRCATQYQEMKLNTALKFFGS